MSTSWSAPTTSSPTKASSTLSATSACGIPDGALYLLSRARAPELVEAKDIVTYSLDGEPADAKRAKGVAPYIERFIHGTIYEARPDVQSIVHNHSPSTIPFGVTGTALKPVQHMCASISHEVPLWDSQDRFGDTALLVNSMEMGRDLAKRLGEGSALLMRGHGAVVASGSIRQAVFVSVISSGTPSCRCRP